MLFKLLTLFFFTVDSFPAIQTNNDYFDLNENPFMKKSQDDYDYDYDFDSSDENPQDDYDYDFDSSDENLRDDYDYDFTFYSGESLLGTVLNKI